MARSNKRSRVCDLRIPTDAEQPEAVSFSDGDSTINTIPPSTPEIPGKTNFDKDLSKILEAHHFGEYSLGRSFPSKGLFSVSVPDPVDPEAKFVYNYFTPNERAYIETEPSNILYDSSAFDDKDIQFIASTDQEPRYVKLTFAIPRMSGVSAYTDKLEIDISPDEFEDYFMGSFSDVGEDITLDDLVNKINIEGASSNYNFTGVEIVDTFADKKIYTMLSGSITLLDIDSPVDSPRERAELFREKIKDELGMPNPTGLDKLSLVDVLTELQPAGISLAQGDVEDAVAQVATDPITKQSFSVKFNNLFIDDILRNSAIKANTVFEDEIRALCQFSENIQSKAINTIDPSYTYDHDHQLSIEPIKIEPIVVSQDDIDDVLTTLTTAKSLIVSHFQNLIDSGASFPGEFSQAESVQTRLLQMINRGILNPINFILKQRPLPKVTIVGYMIQKTEIKSDGTTQDFPNIFIDNPRNFSSFIDKEVRYGAVYNYKMRTIAIVSSVIAVVNQSSSSQGTKDYAVADYLIASDGKTIGVECVENIPPPAPVRLNAFIDYKYRKPVLTWEFPLNKQRDIKRFQIFKREAKIIDGKTIQAIDQPFTLVAEYDFDNSIFRTNPNELAQPNSIYRLQKPIKQYRDADFNLTSDDAIYTVACVDAHGLSSNYSMQLHVKYDRYTNVLHKNVVSFKEAPKPYPNLHIDVDFFKDLLTSSGKKRCNLFFDPEYFKLIRKRKSPSGEIIDFDDVNYIKTSDTDFNYTFQMINIDLQEEQSIKIRIADRSGKTVGVRAAKISPTNLNFEFGSKE